MIEGKGKSIALAFFPVVAINQIFPRFCKAKLHIYYFAGSKQNYYLVNC